MPPSGFLLNNWCRFATVFSLSVILSNAVIAQQRSSWRAAVAPEQINVYASSSTRASVNRTLRHGEVVNVILDVNVMGDLWCGVALLDQPELLGYVLCLNLEENKDNSVPKQATQNQSPTQPRAQLAYAMQPTQKPTSTVIADPTVLTNSDILNMNRMGLSTEVLVAKIKSSPNNFDTSPSQLQQLKSSGLPDAVILAMVLAPTGQSKLTPSSPPVTNGENSVMPSAIPSDGKVRVFVTDSQSWETRGGGSAGGNRNGWGSSSWIAGGARPQTAEIIKTLNQRCPELIVTNNLGKADFVLTLDHEGGKGALAHRNKIAVFNRDSDDIFSNSTRALGNAVKDACQAMLNGKK
jgi:hypothetical protein